MRAAIFLNGSPDPPGLIRKVAGRADLVVAADGGARHALEAGVIPDLVVGDMDSLGEELALEAERRGASLERHPASKDKMDGHLAVVAARRLGADAAELLCATGGRIDALFAVPHVLLAAERTGLRAAVVAGWGGAFVVEAGSRTLGGSRRTASPSSHSRDPRPALPSKASYTRLRKPAWSRGTLWVFTTRWPAARPG